MRTPLSRFISFWFSTFILALMPSLAFAQSAGPRADNYYAAGNRVEISAPMPADVIVAGRDVVMKQPIVGDVIAAGWRIELASRAEDDVRLAGSEVIVNAPIAGDATIAGGSVRLGPETQVGGRSWITGQSVEVNGVLERELNVAAANVIITGEVRKPVRIVAERLDIRPGARLLAAVDYRGPNEATISKDATLAGPFTYTHIEPREARQARAMPGISTMLFILHLFLAGLLVIVLMPRTERSIIETLRSQPLASLLAGFALVVTIPFAAAFLVLSVLGLPIGLVLAALYAVALFAAVLTSAFSLGEAEARWLQPQARTTRGRDALTLLAGVLTLALLRIILGGFATFVAVVFGFGALGVWSYQTYRQAHATAAA